MESVTSLQANKYIFSNKSYEDCLKSRLIGEYNYLTHYLENLTKPCIFSNEELIHNMATPISTIHINCIELHKSYNDVRIELIKKAIVQVQGILKGKTDHNQFEISNALDECIQLYNSTNLIVNTDISKVVRTKGDKDLFKQVVCNIFDNSMDSMKHLPKKVLTLDIKEKGKMVILTFKDSGTGVKQHNINKIFEKGYTTKPKHTGIGLFFVRNVIEGQFQGRISVRNRSKVGVIVKIQIPKY